MQIYFRNEQLNRLDSIFDSVKKGSNFVLLSGKRRVGKTTLAREHLRSRRGAYISVSIKASALQLGDISDYLKTFDFTGDFIPGFRSWEEFFLFIFHIAKDKPVNLVVDEFHNFEKTEPDFLSSLKGLWDLHASKSMLNLIVISNNEHFVNRTFFQPGGQLYGINNHTIRIKPFSFSEVLKIAKLHSSTLSFRNIKTLYLIFGGLPKFYYLIYQSELWKSSVEEILRELIFRKYAPLSYELNELIATELGRENKVYLSILQSIALGKNVVSEIAESVSIPVTNTGKYLGELEKQRGLIKRKVPLGTADPSKSKNGKYFFRNYFDNFWFRFIQPDIISYELGEFDRMMKRVMEELDAYIRERYPLLLKEIFRECRSCREILKITGSPDVIIGELWTRKTSFDLALIDDRLHTLKLCRIYTLDNRATVPEIKILKQDQKEIEKQYPKYKPELVLFSENQPPAGVLELLPPGIKIFRIDHLEEVIKSGNAAQVLRRQGTKRHGDKPVRPKYLRKKQKVLN